MDNMQVEFARWLAATQDKAVLAEMRALQDKGDYPGIQDRFAAPLRFGTGGLRGIMGAGPARMNSYTVGRATRGLGAYLRRKYAAPAVAIAYDSRRHSKAFAHTVAGVLAQEGIKAWIFPTLMPTPALSFAVRYLACAAGVCITASHNPAEYNGYKVYGPDGCQISQQQAADIEAAMEEQDYFGGPAPLPLEEGLAAGTIQLIPQDVTAAYLAAVDACRVEAAPLEDIRAVYTPLHGAGLACVQRALATAGLADLHLVQSQAAPNGEFPTCPVPNPERPDALQAGLALCRETRADLLLATDPDCDRVGVAVRQGNGYIRLSGNQVGLLLLEYLAVRKREEGTLPPRALAVTTIVSTPLADAVAQDLGVCLRRTLTGFKYIGEQIGQLEKQGDTQRFLLGFEESCGYLPGTYVRDKDGVAACLLVSDMCAYYKRRGKTLFQVLQALYARYGWCAEDLLSVDLPGARGMARLECIMAALRQSPPDALGGRPVCSYTDYATGAPMPGAPERALPPANVLRFDTARSRVIFRPSGTEPKLKIYLACTAPTEKEAADECKPLAREVRQLVSRLEGHPALQADADI